MWEAQPPYNMNPESRICQTCKSSFEIIPDDFTFYEKLGVQPPKLCPQCRARLRLAFRNKQYCVFNKPLGKEAYEKFLAEARLDTQSGTEAMQKKFEEFMATQPKKYAEIVNAPGCSGNYISDAKNCRECFHSYDAEDCAYGEHVWRNAKDCVDVSTAGRNASMIYNSINAGIDTSHYVSCAVCWTCSFMEYSINCFNSNHCFGSVGLRKKDYCILNKQYSKEEFEELRIKIVEEMKAKGEYGEFFPATMSPFGYNETVAQEQFPLAKEEAVALGFGWEEYPRGTYGRETVEWKNVPDSIRDFKTGDINKDIFVCTECKKNYRIIPAELQFYTRLEIPLPRLCPDCRHARRINARGPNKLTAPQQCRCETSHPHHQNGRCPNMFRSSYPADTKEILYCENCYQSEFV